MKAILTNLAPAALAIALLGGRSARADALADFQAGTDVQLRTGTANIGSTSTIGGGVVIAKAAGTLDFAVAAADLGIPLNATIHLHGTPSGNGHVLYTVDDSFTGVTIGGQNLARITGMLTAKASRIPGATAPQIGDMRLLFDMGQLVAYGDWGIQPVSITNFEIIGGTPQPGLTAFVDTGDKLVCSDTVATAHSVAVWLSGPAVTGGASIDLAVTKDAISLPNTVMIPAGHRSTNVTARVPANFVGTAHVTAASGGGASSFDITVHPHATCSAAPATKPAIEQWVPSKISGCTNCTTFFDVNHDTERLTTINGITYVIAASGQVIELARVIPGTTAIAAGSINNDGTVAGRLTINGVTQAYRANVNHGTPVPELLGPMVPEAINNYNVVVGYRVVNGASQAVYAGPSVMPFSLASPYGVAASRALDINDSDQVIGTYTDDSGVVRGFRWIAGTTTTLPLIGGRPALPIAINSSGQIAANAQNSAGLPVAAIISGSTVTLLGVPPGSTSFQVKSINRFGAVVGVANLDGAPRAFVWKPGVGFHTLTGYVSGLTATDAVRITDANQAVITGTLNGVTDNYLLTL